MAAVGTNRTGVALHATALCAALIAVQVGACNGEDAAPEPGERAEVAVGVRAVPVTAGVLERQAAFTGELRAETRVEVASEVSGRIVELTFEEGDLVERGQVLARVDDALARAREREAEAELESARASESEARVLLERARNEVERRVTLVERSAFPAAELDRLRDDVAVAEQALHVAAARREAAEASLGVTRTERGLSEIRAPLSGVVSLRHVSTGAMVSPQAPIASLYDPDSLRFVVRLPESALGAVEVGTSSSIRLDGLPGTTLDGHVVRVGAEVSRESRTVEVLLAVTAEATLRDGMFGRGRIVTARSAESSLLPKEAIVEGDGDDYSFWAIEEDGTVRRVPIEVQLRNADAVAFRAEREASRAVLAPPMGLSDGVRVEVVEESAPVRSADDEEPGQ
jgi:RND family efflux transporter MFP subunit